MRNGMFLAIGVWVLPALVIACGKDDGDTDGPPADELTVLDLGAAAVADTGDFTGEKTIDVPEGSTSAAFYCGGYGDAALGAVWTLTDPSGTVVWDRDEANDPMKYRSDFLDDMATGLLPLTPNLPISAGAVGNNDNGSRPSAPLVTRIRFLAGFHPLSTGASSSE